LPIHFAAASAKIATVINVAWDHNSYYHERLLRALPPRCGRVLDVGCGAGRFAARLAEQADRVDALDASPAMITEAQLIVPANVTRETRSGCPVSYGHLSLDLAVQLGQPAFAVPSPGEEAHELIGWIVLAGLPLVVVLAALTALVRLLAWRLGFGSPVRSAAGPGQRRSPEPP
jgi:SAM-dependent methyltransferase